MTADQKLRRAAEDLWRAWTSEQPLDAVPDELRPDTVEEGYAVQRALDDLAGPATGWKIAATSKAGQDHLGASGPLVGRLYESEHQRSGSALSVRAMQMRSAEPEFAFVLAARPGGRSRELSSVEVVGAVGSMVLAIEVPDSRFVDFGRRGFPRWSQTQCAAVISSPAPDRRLALPRLARAGGPAAVQRRGALSGARRERDGRPTRRARVDGERGTGHGWSLRAGDMVLTGAAAPPMPILPGDAVLAEFDGLGNVEVAFS